MDAGIKTVAGKRWPVISRYNQHSPFHRTELALVRPRLSLEKLALTSIWKTGDLLRTSPAFLPRLDQDVAPQLVKPTGRAKGPVLHGDEKHTKDGPMSLAALTPPFD